jgi:hypothetical protein
MLNLQQYTGIVEYWNSGILGSTKKDGETETGDLWFDRLTMIGLTCSP